MHKLRIHIFAVGFVALYCIGLSAAFIAGGMPYQDDAGRETMPQMHHYAKWLKQGAMPLWNSRLGSGYYQHATGQSAMTYPPNLLLYRLLDWTVAYRASLALHVFAACVWSYLLGLALGLSVRSALLLSICIGSGGVMAAHQIHINIVLGVSHLLLMLWLATQWLRDDRSWVWALAGGVALGLSLLGGQPQYVWLAALIAGICAAVMWSCRAMPMCRFGLLAARAALVGVMGLLLSAVQTLPLYYYATRFPRPQPAGHYDFVTAGSFQWADFLRFLVPAPALKSDMGMQHWETFGFVGTATLLLAALALLTGRRWSPRVRFAVVLIAVGTLLMLGSNTPLYHMLAHVPPFSLLRVPARNVIIVGLGLALLAADYLDIRVRKTDIRHARWRWPAVAAAIALLTAVAAWHIGPYQGLWLDVALAACVLVVMAVAQALPGKHTSLAWAAVGCSVVQLGVVWHLLNPTAPGWFWTERPAAAELVLSRTVHAGEKVACLEPATPTWTPQESKGILPGDWRDRLAANTCSVFGVPSALVGDAILPVAAMYADTHLRRTSSEPQEMADLCTRLGIKWVSMPPEPLGPPWVRHEPHHPHLYENPSSVGSFFLCNRTVAGPGGYPRPAPPGGPYELQPVACSETGPGRFALNFTAESPTTLFIMQGYYPGWFATVGGKTVPLQPAQPGGFFMHLPVPAGEHEVHLSFEPWDYDVGLALTLATAALVCLAFGIAAWEAKKTWHAPGAQG